MNKEQATACVATFFGGPYDTYFGDYRTPTVTGLSVVRGAFHKTSPTTDMWLNLPDGTPTGSLLIVFIRRQRRQRLSLPMGTGLKEVKFDVELHTWTASFHRNGEDSQHDHDTLIDGIIDKIESDPTFGTNGLESAGLTFAEGDLAGMDIEYNPPGTDKNNVTHQYTLVRANAIHVLNR